MIPNVEPVHPQCIEDSPYVVLRVCEYERLQQWSPATAHSSPPQFLKDGDGKMTHVVLMDRDYLELLANEPSPDYLFHIIMPQKRVVACGIPCPPEGMAVLRGSVVGYSVPSFPYEELKQTLIDDDVIAQTAGQWVFKRDFTFENPSTAACIVTGNSKNGNDVWKDRNGVSLKERGLGKSR
jgi:hypothetical protein